MVRRLRGVMIRPDGNGHREPVIELLIAMVKRARRDIELPERVPGSSSLRNPTAEEKREARRFLGWCEETFRPRCDEFSQ